jgi:hypothetical protein
MNIYTYHEPIDNFPYQHNLLVLWEDAWSRLGWTPKVLTAEFAKQHVLYEPLAAHFTSHLPTANTPAYELSCYARWLAMAVIGGGWMSDADVIPYSFWPMKPCSDRMTILSQGNPVPCLVHGSKDEYERIVRDVFLRHKGGVYAGNHSSDQDILQINRGEFQQIELVSVYKDEGWDKTCVVHYNNDSVGYGLPRSEIIPSLRPFPA